VSVGWVLEVFGGVADFGQLVRVGDIHRKRRVFRLRVKIF
jgi:hypothetical protein